MTSVTIPEGVTLIGESAFSRCNSLAKVYYLGTEADFKKITISDIDNEPFEQAAKQYISVSYAAPGSLNYDGTPKERIRKS